MLIILFNETEMKERLEKIKAAKDAADLLRLTYLHLFDVDLNDPEIEDGEVKATDYRMSSELANELIDHSIELDGEKYATAINLLWLNFSPSMRPELPRHEVQMIVAAAKQRKKAPA